MLRFISLNGFTFDFIKIIQHEKIPTFFHHHCSRLRLAGTGLSTGSKPELQNKHGEIQDHAARSAKHHEYHCAQYLQSV